MHECGRCGYKTRATTHLRRHLEQKVPCVPLDATHNISRHELLSQLEGSKRKYVKRTENQGNVPQVVNIFNANIQHLHVHLNDFGRESLNHIRIAGGDGGALLNALPDVSAFLRAIHFDPSHPENHNLCVTNVKDDVAFIVKETEFQPASARGCAEDFLLRVKHLMDVYLSWNEDDIPSSCTREWREFIQLVSRAFRPECTSDAQERRKMHRKIREKMDEVLRVMHFESQKLWPAGRRSMLHNTNGI